MAASWALFCVVAALQILAVTGSRMAVTLSAADNDQTTPSEATENVPHSKRTRVVRETVYRLQRNFFTENLGNSNVATEIGELVFLQSVHVRMEMEKYMHRDDVMISQHELEFEIMYDPAEANEHYIRFDGGKGHKEWLWTVGVQGGDRGGWLSLPSKLQCGRQQE